MVTVTAPYGEALEFYVALTNRSTGQLQANPTLASGDVTLSKDGGAFANLGTLPTVTPTSGRGVKVTMTATERQASSSLLLFVDQSGAEWNDLAVLIQSSDKDGYSLSALGLDVLVEAVDDQFGAQLDTIQGKTDLILTGSVTVSSAVSESGDVTLYSGDDYTGNDVLTWSSSDWPDLGSATISMSIANSDAAWTPVCAVVSSGGATQTVSVALQAADTATLRVGIAYDFRIKATISGNVTTLVQGILTVEP